MSPPEAQRKTFLVLSLVYPPDPASVGQYMQDAATEMARRGHRVVVLASARGYDDPSQVYPARQELRGVTVRRLPLTSFGKASIARRLVGAVSFVVQAAIRGLFLRRLSGVLVSTSPPIGSLAALAISCLRGVPVTYWVMDLNPDQTVAIGLARPASVGVRLFEWLNHRILRRAAQVVALDRFMAERLERKVGADGRVRVLPLWSHEDHLGAVEHRDNPFRREHGLEDRFVILHSGNLSIVSPVTTVLEAALRLQDDDGLIFVFVGGGLGRTEVEEFVERARPGNILLLPYEPLERIRYSMSAADVHLVPVGDAIVGICHPSKVYGAMAVARPILLVGPDPCHVSEILAESRSGVRVAHGDVDGLVEAIHDFRRMPPAEREEMGRRGHRQLTEKFSKARLCGAFCDLMEAGA